MKDGWKTLAMILFGVLLGACARHLVIAKAAAQTGHGYLVVVGSATPDGYRNDLNKYGREGWRFVGTVPVGSGPPMLVLEQ